MSDLKLETGLKNLADWSQLPTEWGYPPESPGEAVSILLKEFPLPEGVDSFYSHSSTLIGLWLETNYAKNIGPEFTPIDEALFKYEATCFLHMTGARFKKLLNSPKTPVSKPYPEELYFKWFNDYAPFIEERKSILNKSKKSSVQSEILEEISVKDQIKAKFRARGKSEEANFVLKEIHEKYYQLIESAFSLYHMGNLDSEIFSKLLVSAMEVLDAAENQDKLIDNHKVELIVGDEKPIEISIVRDKNANREAKCVAIFWHSMMHLIQALANVSAKEAHEMLQPLLKIVYGKNITPAAWKSHLKEEKIKTHTEIKEAIQKRYEKILARFPDNGEPKSFARLRQVIEKKVFLLDPH